MSSENSSSTKTLALMKISARPFAQPLSEIYRELRRFSHVTKAECTRLHYFSSSRATAKLSEALLKRTTHSSMQRQVSAKQLELPRGLIAASLWTTKTS